MLWVSQSSCDRVEQCKTQKTSDYVWTNIIGQLRRKDRWMYPLVHTDFTTGSINFRNSVAKRISVYYQVEKEHILWYKIHKKHIY